MSADGVRLPVEPGAEAPGKHDASHSVEDSSGDLRNLARGGTLSLTGSIVGALLQFLLAIVVTRSLTSEGAGVFFEAVALFTILSIAAQFGAETGVLRTVSRMLALGEREHLRGVFLVSLAPVMLIGIGFAIGVFLLAPALADVFMHGSQRAVGITYLRVLAPFIPLAATSKVALAGTRGFGAMLPYVAIENIGKPLLRPVLAMIAIAAGLGGTALMLAWVLPAALELPITLAVVLALLRREERAVAAPSPRRAATGLAKDFWRFAAPRGMASLFQVTVLWLDVLLVGALASPREAGIYAATSRFAIIGILGLEAIRIAISPQMSKLLARRERERAQRLYQVATWWAMAASWPFYVMLAVFAPFVLRIFGPGFAEGQSALLILSLAMLVNLGTGNVTVVLLMGGKSWWNLLNTVVSLGLNIVLNIVLIPRLGMTGAAIAWAVSITFENLAPLVQVGRLLRLHPFGRGYLRVAAASVLCFGGLGIIARSWFGLGLGSLVLVSITASAAYFVVLWKSRSLLELSTLRHALRPRPRGGVTSGSSLPTEAPRDGNAGGISGASAPVAVLKKGAKSGLRAYGVATSQLRVSPDFVIVGAKRAGTTSLFRYLEQHPGIAGTFPRRSRIKGARFFDTNFHRGIAWYRSHFPTRLQMRRLERSNGFRAVTGEASPYYLFHPWAAARAGRVVPEARLVILLRNPVDRAYSHYRERVRHGDEDLSFEEAIEREPERLRGEMDRLLGDKRYYSRHHEHHSYVSQGRYLESLKRWLALFPRERVLLLKSEDFFRDPQGVYSKVLLFLGLPQLELTSFEAHNFHLGQPMQPRTRERLLVAYRDDNRRLAESLDMDLSDWSV